MNREPPRDAVKTAGLPVSRSRGRDQASEDGFPEGNAVVYCGGAFGTTNGKTAHGLVRRSERYRVLSVIDSRHAGSDAGKVLDSNRLVEVVLQPVDRPGNLIAVAVDGRHLA